MLKGSQKLQAPDSGLWDGNMKQWYDGLAEVPGLGYKRSTEIERKNLPGYNDRPEIRTYEFDGKRRTGISWPWPNGSTSASPAHRRNTLSHAEKPNAEAALRQLLEILELPGELSDYHFAIQACHEILWKHRHQAPWVAEKVFELCWLDIHLLEAYPKALAYEFDEPGFMPRILAFERLRLMYQREGYLHEALDVAQRAAKLAQGKTNVDELQTLIAALEAEGVV